MEIKLNFHLQSILNFIKYMENLELETAILIVVAMLLAPFMFVSLWSLGIAVMCQLFWLGVKAGIILFVVSAAYLAFLKVSNLNGTTTTQLKTGPKCTLLDIMLSVLFQLGLRIPTVIWDRLVKTQSGGTTGVQKGNGNRSLWAGNQNRDIQQPVFRAIGDSKDHSTAVADDSSDDDLFKEFGVGGGSGDYLPRFKTAATGGTTTTGTRRRRGNRAGGGATGTRKSSRNK